MANIMRRGPSDMPDWPINSLRRNMNRLFNELMDWTESFYTFGDVRVDVVERDNDILIKADVPGLDDKNLDIEVTENDVTINGKYEEENKEEDKGYIVRERRSGAFRRTIPINVEIIPEQAKATFKNGVVEIIVPKAENAKRKAVKVKIDKAV